MVAYVELALMAGNLVDSPALALALILWGWRTRNPFRVLVGFACAFFAHPTTTLYAALLLSIKHGWDGMVGMVAWIRGLCCPPPVIPMVQAQPSPF